LNEETDKQLALDESVSPQEKKIEQLTNWIWALPSEGEAGYWNVIRAFCRVPIIVCQEFLIDKIPLRASALTFTVILSMVPVLALGTAVLKGLGAGGQMRESAHTFIEQLEFTSVPVAGIIPTGRLFIEPESTPELPAPESEELIGSQQPALIEARNTPEPPLPDSEEAVGSLQTVPEAGDGQTAPQTSLSGHLHRVVDLVFDYVDNTDFAALGIVGVLVLFLAVFSVMNSIEQAMNDIWQTRSSRSAGHKVLDYLALMVLLPITINLGVATMAALQSETLLGLLNGWLPWIGPQLLNFLPFLAVVLTFTLLYSFLPDTKIRFGSALAGGVFGGILWLLVQMIYFKLQIGVARYNTIYGSFASLPLFLLWIHFGWMVFLAGAEVSFAVQVWRRYQWRGFRLTPMNRLGLAFEVVAIAAADYQQKVVTTRLNLIQLLKQPDTCIREILDDLSEAGILRYVKDERGYVPAGPVAELSALEIADLMLGKGTTGLSEKNPASMVLRVIQKTLATKKIVAAENYRP
jgi:membrane protein